MFQGEHTNNMDDKGRVSIPASFRDTLMQRYDDERIIITRDYDGCLRGYPPKEWERRVIDPIRDRGMSDPKVRAFERFVVSAACECTPDKQGRILIPPTLRAHSALSKCVVFAGMTYYFEIWDESRWASVLEQAQNLLKAGELDF